MRDRRQGAQAGMGHPAAASPVPILRNRLEVGPICARNWSSSSTCHASKVAWSTCRMCRRRGLPEACGVVGAFGLSAESFPAYIAGAVPLNDAIRRLPARRRPTDHVAIGAGG